MRQADTFTGMIVKRRRTLFGKYHLILSDTRRTVTIECGELLFDCLCEGIQLTVVHQGKQLISWHPAGGKEESITPIAETPVFQHGEPLYYRSSRCWNTPELQADNQGLFTGEELVSFDCCLFDLLPVLRKEIEVPCPEHQYLAVIVEPETQPSTIIAQDGRFTFCGYDLIEEQTQISAITNCGGGFGDAIRYNHLNALGLFNHYAEAKQTQNRLRRAYPDEPHADCVIVEIWRYIAQ